jgi:hypothetical protein
MQKNFVKCAFIVKLKVSQRKINIKDVSNKSREIQYVVSQNKQRIGQLPVVISKTDRQKYGTTKWLKKKSFLYCMHGVRY